jgi:hypothetical protein
LGTTPSYGHSGISGTRLSESVSIVLGIIYTIAVLVNPGLKYNLLFWFMYFCTSVYFKTSEKKTADSDKISEEPIGLS